MFWCVAGRDWYFGGPFSFLLDVPRQWRNLLVGSQVFGVFSVLMVFSDFRVWWFFQIGFGGFFQIGLLMSECFGYLVTFTSILRTTGQQPSTPAAMSVVFPLNTIIPLRQ